VLQDNDMTFALEENREPTIFNSLLVRIFVGIFLFIALLYRQTDLALLTFLILLVMSAARIWSSLSLYRVRCTINVNKQRVFSGETFVLETRVENAKLLPVRLRVQWSLDSAFRRVGGDEHGLRQEAGLLWYQRAQLHWDLVARRRGVYRMGPDCIRAGDLLGFFEKEKRSRDSISILVYPRLVRLKSFSLPMRDLFGVPGAKSPVKDPVYILGTRDYQPSGPSRHIHWKASARHLRLQEKVFEPSEQEKVMLALEVGSFEKITAKEAFENTLEVIASLAVQLQDRGCAVGLATNGILTGGGLSVLPATRAPGQLPAILEILARLQAAQKSTMQPIMRQAMGSRRSTSCIYFAYRAGPAAVETVKACRQQNIPITFFVCRSDPESEAIRQEIRAGMHTLDEIHIRGIEPV
jgi:uncharacterized protein (DUF58 family)